MKKHPEIILDEKTHTYYVDGFRVKGVSEILAENNISPKYFNAENSADFGTKLHKTLELYDTGLLGEYDERLEPYLKAWQQFRLNQGIKVFFGIEQVVYSRKLRCCGRLDRAVEIDKHTFIVDIKSSNKIEPHHFIQAAGYMELYNSLTKEKAKGAAVVRLYENNYEIQWTKPIHRKTFLAAVQISKWRTTCRP